MTARILIVEDEAVVAMDLRLGLTALGYHVTGVAGTGVEALRLAGDEATRPDLVLMDIHLRGGMDGVEVARRLDDIPVIYLTAYADPDTRGRAFGAEPFGYLVKPFAERDLQVAVELAIYRSKLERERRRAEAAHAARAVAEEAVRVREEFLSIAAHELKTPLTSLGLQLQSLIRLVHRDPAALPDERARSRIVAVAAQVDRLERLVAGLLDVSRLTAGRVLLEREDFDLAEVFREIGDRVADEAARAGSEVTADLYETRGSWDRMRLEQIATNLLGNAIKYGAGRPIEVRVAPVGTLARITVADRGIGIAEADRARVFERFERAVSARHYGGLGLGLYITRELVAAHEGRIWIEETPGGGTTFLVELPLS